MDRIRTEARQQKIKSVLQRRRNDLTLILENIFDPHNISAILRTADAVGIMEVHVINSTNPTVKKLGKRSSASAKKWMKVHYHNSVDECIPSLKEKGFKVYATHLNQQAKSVYDYNYVIPVAVALGNEHYGVTEELINSCDGTVYIPMHGMIQSLNVSVASAVCLYEVLRQRNATQQNPASFLSNEEQQILFEEWVRK